MNALTRKFRVASTTGVVMSLAMAGVLAMAPMSNAMAKSQKGKTATVTVSTGAGYYAAWGMAQAKAGNGCGNYYASLLRSKQYKKGSMYTFEGTYKCV